MFKALKDFLDNIAAQVAPASPVPREHTTHLATAVLLIEVMRADSSKSTDERSAVMTALRSRFSLTPSEGDALLALAESTASSAGDYHAFTSSLNEHFTHPEKISLVESLWQVAYSDAHLDAAENHAINKIAGLLHVTHGEYIGAKMRAKEAAGLLQGDTAPAPR